MTTSLSAESTSLAHRHLLDVSGYTDAELRLIIATAQDYRKGGTIPAYPDATVATLFFEPSTRTKTSFQQAAQRLAARTVSVGTSGSSVVKGESLKDTAQTIEALQADVFVVRHASPGAAHFVAQHTDGVVVNAGDGARAHPTQALLDACTLADHYADVSGLHVAIIGDITHSRVARSNIRLLRTLGAEVTVCGPPTLLPAELEEMGAHVTYRLEEALEACDVAMALRLQLERQRAGLFPSLQEYHAQFGITTAHLHAYPDLRIMHPGPVNRGVELEAAVVDHERTMILDQVANGVPVRMSVLALLIEDAG
ncbi:MAG: aspartate carbamoyltransferase catalytic subunit [Longimonas sp.]|uniref:aspartate carbamoyltransferase catalytic subunit n=1 Tax=Longimonas sp. TaxID=2039626 RepID=UPI00335BBE1E